MELATWKKKDLYNCRVHSYWKDKTDQLKQSGFNWFKLVLAVLKWSHKLARLVFTYSSLAGRPAEQLKTEKSPKPL